MLCVDVVTHIFVVIWVILGPCILYVHIYAHTYMIFFIPCFNIKSFIHKDNYAEACSQLDITLIPVVFP